MPKAASPVRLQESIMQAATLAGHLQHRSTAEQIEYWADIGRKVSNSLDVQDLLSVASGLASLKVEPVVVQPVSVEGIFNELEHARSNGTLVTSVTTSSVKYQSSISAPGWLEQIDNMGHIVIGQFINGVFVSRD